MPATVALQAVQALGEVIRELGRRGDADAVGTRQHLAILNDLVGEVLPNVDVLGSLPSADDVVTPLDARRVVFVDGRIPYARGACGGTGPRFPPLKPHRTPPMPWTEP